MAPRVGKFGCERSALARLVYCVLALLLFKPSLALAEDWYVRDWYGGPSEGHCLIATRDEARDRSLYFGFGDGRLSFNNYSYNPSSTITVTNILPPVIDTTFFETTIVFDDVVSIDTIVRSSVVSGAAELSSMQISSNKVVDFFQSKTLDHESLVKLMKASNSMKLIDDQRRVLARFSLLGFTNIFSRYSDCVRSLEP